MQCVLPRCVLPPQALQLQSRDMAALQGSMTEHLVARQRPQTIRFYARLRLKMLLSCCAYVCITGQHPAASVCDHGRWRDGRAGCVCLFSVVLYQAASHTLHLCPPPPRQTHTAAAVHLCCAHAESMRGEAARWQADRQEWLSCIRTLRQEANDKLLQVGAEPI